MRLCNTAHTSLMKIIVSRLGRVIERYDPDSVQFEEAEPARCSA